MRGMRPKGGRPRRPPVEGWREEKNRAAFQRIGSGERGVAGDVAGRGAVRGGAGRSRHETRGYKKRGAKARAGWHPSLTTLLWYGTLGVVRMARRSWVAGKAPRMRRVCTKARSAQMERQGAPPLKKAGAALRKESATNGVSPMGTSEQVTHPRAPPTSTGGTSRAGAVVRVKGNTTRNQARLDKSPSLPAATRGRAAQA